MPDDPEKPEFGKLEADARAFSAARNRERAAGIRGGSTRDSRPAFDRPNPVKEHERHREENAADQARRLRGIADPQRRAQVRAQVEKHYTAWGIGLARAYHQRHDEAPRLYEQKLAALKTDIRTVPKSRKDELHDEAKREAATRSNNRMQAINEEMARKINRVIDEAVKLPPAPKDQLDRSTQRAKTLAADYKARHPGQRDRGRGDPELER